MEAELEALGNWESVLVTIYGDRIAGRMVAEYAEIG